MSNLLILIDKALKEQLDLLLRYCLRSETLPLFVALVLFGVSKNLLSFHR